MLFIVLVTACPETEKTGSFGLAVVGELTITKGQTGLANITIARTDGFDDLITLSLEGQPQGVSASFDPVSTSQTSSKLTLVVSNEAIKGQYQLTIVGSTSTQTQKAFLELIIQDEISIADFSLSVNAIKVKKAASAKTDVTITRVAGFSDLVALSLSGEPNGVSGQFNPQQANNSSELTLTVGNDTVVGDYTLTVTGVSDGKTHTASFVLTIEPKAIQADFSLSVEPVTVIIEKNAIVPNGILGPIKAKTNVTINRTGGFSDLVALTLSVKPDGVNSEFDPESANDSSALTLFMQENIEIKTYTLTVTGVADGKTRTSDFILKVELKEDNQKPAAISVTPAGNAIGVEKTANIVITFSEAMDRAKTEAAYKSNSAGIRANEVSFSWNQAGTVLTINPNNDLKYKAIDNLDELGFEYAFELTNDATDLAGNNLVNTLAPKFRTLRNMTHIIYAEKDAAILKDVSVGACLGDNDRTSSSICIGDGGEVQYDGVAPMGGQVDVTNKPLRGFFSFSISELPDNIKEIKRATFYANQKRTNSGVNNNAYRDLHTPGRYLRIEHVFFGPILRVESFDTPVLHDIGNLSTSPSLGYKAAIVTESLKEDYNLGVGRLNKSQYRLRFDKDTDNDGWIDLVEFYTKEGLESKRPKLIVNYLVP